MATKNNTQVASNNNPTTAGKASTAGTAAGGTSLLTERAAVEAASGLLAQLLVVLAPYARTLPAGDVRRRYRVSATQEAAIPPVARMMRTFPALGSLGEPDALDAATAYVTDLRHLDAALQGASAAVATTARLVLDDSWTQTKDVLTLAKRQGRSDPALASQVATVTGTLKHGSRVASAQAAVLKSGQQTARSQKQIAAAQRRADLAKMVQTQAEARRAPPAPVPAPSPAPAPGTTPHTG